MIKQMIADYIRDTRAAYGRPYAVLETRAGTEGVRFTSPDSEEDEWYAFSDLGYNSAMGFFQRSLFPNQRDESR